MIRFANLLRRGVNASMEATRGPKKKKGDGQAKIESTDIVNIFKERSDPAIKDIREYPVFVQELSLGTHTFHEMNLGIEHNIEANMPQRANYNGFLKALKRQRTISMGKFHHLDRHPNIMLQKDLIDRRVLYAVGVLGKEEQQEKTRLEEQANNALEDDD